MSASSQIQALEKAPASRLPDWTGKSCLFCHLNNSRAYHCPTEAPPRAQCDRGERAGSIGLGMYTCSWTTVSSCRRMRSHVPLKQQSTRHLIFFISPAWLLQDPSGG